MTKFTILYRNFLIWLIKMCKKRFEIKYKMCFERVIYEVSSKNFRFSRCRLYTGIVTFSECFEIQTARMMTRNTMQVSCKIFSVRVKHYEMFQK